RHARGSAGVHRARQADEREHPSAQSAVVCATGLSVDGDSLMELHQIIVSASPGDAVTNQALELQALLRRIGPSEIYARFVHPALDADVLPLLSYPDRSPARDGRVLIYHASIGQAEVAYFLMER